MARAERKNDEVCRRGDAEAAECQVDGSGCPGARVELPSYGLRVTRWDPAKKAPDCRLDRLFWTGCSQDRGN